MDDEQLFSRKDMKEISERLDRIVYNNENSFSFLLSFTIEQALELIHHWESLPIEEELPDENQPITSELFINLFVDSLMTYIKESLEEDGIDYEDEID
jgi:hypothetical protein